MCLRDRSAHRALSPSSCAVRSSFYGGERGWRERGVGERAREREREWGESERGWGERGVGNREGMGRRRKRMKGTRERVTESVRVMETDAV